MVAISRQKPYMATCIGQSRSLYKEVVEAFVLVKELEVPTQEEMDARYIGGNYVNS